MARRAYICLNLSWVIRHYFVFSLGLGTWVSQRPARCAECPGQAPADTYHTDTFKISFATQPIRCTTIPLSQLVFFTEPGANDCQVTSAKDWHCSNGVCICSAPYEDVFHLTQSHLWSCSPPTPLSRRTYTCYQLAPLPRAGGAWCFSAWCQYLCRSLLGNYPPISSAFRGKGATNLYVIIKAFSDNYCMSYLSYPIKVCLRILFLFNNQFKDGNFFQISFY